MPDDEKRKKSWREIDKGRDRGGTRRPSDREHDNFQKSTKYTQYKTNLDRLFSGGVPLPDELQKKLDPTGESTAKDDARKKLGAIDDAKAFNAAAVEFIAAHGVPDDPRILDRLLAHGDEGVVAQALGRLEELHAAGTLKAPPALGQRLTSLEIETGDRALRERAATLRKKLR